MRIRVFQTYLFLAAIMVPAIGKATGVTVASTPHSLSKANEPDSIVENVKNLDEAVVTAVRPGVDLSTPVPVFKIDESKILRTGVTDISDAIHRLPGATLRDYGGAGGMKTVSVRGLGASHTAVIYDGIPLTDAQNSAIDLSRYTLDNVSSLELVIGDNTNIFIPAKVAASPASLAISGVSFNAEKPVEFAARVKAGSFGYVSPSLMFGKQISQKMRLGVSGEFIHTDNNYPFVIINGNLTTREKRENNRMNSGHAEANMAWTPRPESRITGKIYWYDNSRRLPGPVMYYNVNASNERLQDKNIFAQTEYLQDIASKWKFRVAGKFDWSATLYSDFDRKQNGDYLRENYFQREYYLTANLLFTPTSHWSFDYSADYDFNNLNSNLSTDKHPYRHSILQSLTAKGRYNRFTLLGRLIYAAYLNGSAPGTESAADYSRLSPALSLSARLLSSGLLYARISYKNIFRMPSFSENYFSHLAAPELKPEITDQIDFGLTYQLPSTAFISFIALTADIYRNWVHDRIVAVPYNMFVWTITNLNSVHSLGADLTLNGTLDFGRHQQLLISGTWSYQRAMINVPSSEILYRKQVAYVPHNSGSFSLSYENPWANLVVHGQGTSARYTDNSNIPQTRLPGYFEFGLTLWREFRLKKHGIELRFDILNILNKQYMVIARYPMPGRSFMASVKFNL